MNQIIPRRIAVFFYGLFMDADLLRTMRMHPANIRMASVLGFSLRIGQRATLIPAPNGRVYGVLMELTHAEIDALYSEPSVASYRPEAVVADLTDGSRIPSLCFTLPMAPSREEVNPDYAARLRSLAVKLGLPPAYIETIQ